MRNSTCSENSGQCAGTTTETSTLIAHPRLSAIESLLSRFISATMFVTCIALAILMFTQVIFRYVLSSPFVGIEEVSILLAVWIYFLGMGYATKSQEHIQGGILSLVVSDPIIFKTVRLFGSVLCMIAACIFGYFACKYALKEIDRGRSSIVMQWPRWIWSSSMVVGFTMMILYFLLQSYKEWIQLTALKTQQSGAKL